MRWIAANYCGLVAFLAAVLRKGFGKVVAGAVDTFIFLWRYIGKQVSRLPRIG